MKFVVPSIIAATALTISGCETATPYQHISQNSQTSGGYSDQQIEADRWRVTFAGNSLTSRDTVERYLLFRAAQLSIKLGYDWFSTVQRHTDKETDYIGDADWGGLWGPQWGLYDPVAGWGYGYWDGPGWAGWNGAPVDIEQVRRFQASAEIVMGHGQKPPGDRHAFDARSVISHLQATIQYPKP